MEHTRLIQMQEQANTLKKGQIFGRSFSHAQIVTQELTYARIVHTHRAKLFKTHHGNAILKDNVATPAPTPALANPAITETPVAGVAGGAAVSPAVTSQQQALFNSLFQSPGAGGRR
jgi:hypothetical protein